LIGDKQLTCVWISSSNDILWWLI